MKRNTLLFCAVVAVSALTAESANACFYTPWLDPLAWFGFYGQGCGYGCGGCHQGMQPMYRPAPIMNYPAAPISPGCNCNSAVAPAPQLTAVQVPVTTYRAVTQYVPQTSYRTQYQYAQPSVAYAQPSVAYAPATIPTQAYAPSYPAPLATAQVYPSAPTYSSSAGFPATVPQPTYSNPSTSPLPQGYYNAAPTYPPVIHNTPSVASPLPIPAGDINGDHEYPTQSARTFRATPTPMSQPRVTPIRRVSYGVTPRSARSYPAAIR